MQNACRTICKVYSHSPVFRIGGDEFVAILQKEDWKKQAELEQQFTQAMADVNATAANPWDRVNVAIGTANYNPETDPDMESVFRRADVLMYENKKQMKEANKKKEEKIKELQEFINRFSANASKSKRKMDGIVSSMAAL